jgi:hypothetical protein
MVSLTKPGTEGFIYVMLQCLQYVYALRGLLFGNKLSVSVISGIISYH